MNVTLRSIEPSDIETCGAVIYKAFAAFAAQTGFPPSFPSIEAATAIARSLTEDHTVFGVAAEQNGRLIGSNFLTMGDRICGVGPVTVLPTAQGSGIGRQLMEAILERGKAAEGIRLVQDSANILLHSAQTGHRHRKSEHQRVDCRGPAFRSECEPSISQHFRKRAFSIF